MSQIWLDFLEYRYFIQIPQFDINNIPKSTSNDSMSNNRLFNQQSPIIENALDMSSIQDNSNDKSNISNPDLDIQEMGLQAMEELENQQSFRANVRQLLSTQRQFNDQICQASQNCKANKDFIDQDEFQGQTVKGQFLRDMDILGKTMSFESTCYNIYEGYCENQYILSSIKEQKNSPSQQIKRLSRGFRKVQQNSAQIQLKYIIDFSKTKKGNKSTKPQSKCKSNKKHPNKSKIFSQFHNSTNSFSNCIQRPCSQKKQKKSIHKNVTNKKMSKNIQEQYRCSEQSWQYNSNKEKKGSASQLKKVRYNSTVGDLLRGRKSQVLNPSMLMSQVMNREQRKKKIEQKLNLRSTKA